MRDTSPPHVDTSAWFANGRYRGAVMPAEDTLEAGERERARQRMPVRVYNARGLDPPPTLDRHGFQLVRTGTPPPDPRDHDALEAAFRASGRALVTALTGCRDTRVVHRQYRNGFAGLPAGHALAERRQADGVPAAYALTMHTDLSPWVETEPRWDDLAQGRHCAMYNLWRSTDPEREILQMPLAVCDVRYVAERDMIAACAYEILPDNAFVTYLLAHNPFQSWFYYPRMAPDEVLVFKLYDTREERPSRRGVFHGAVRDPGTPTDAARRQSMDMRILARFDEEHDLEARRSRFLASLPPIPDGLGLRSPSPAMKGSASAP